MNTVYMLSVSRKSLRPTVLTPYSPGVDDLSAAEVAPPALGIGARILLTDVANTDCGLALPVGIIALTLAIVYLPRLFRRR